jgi:oxygen-independent coproporphyrinogen III oxidase
MGESSDLLKKYNVPGPRYTSYPTVPYWSDTPTEAQWIDSISSAIDESERRKVGAALYIHIPFCESLCTYCGCNTRITRNHKVGLPYVESILKEWRLYLAKLNRKITISEIHLGGGTPTFLTPSELEQLIEGIVREVHLDKDYEFSVEADPRKTQKEQLETLYKFGFRRLSLGIQDFDPVVQEIVHRVQSEEQVRTITEIARTIGFHSINYDLIYGLPLQNLKSIEHTIRMVRELRPDRIAFYSYAHVPWIRPGQRRFSEADVPAGDKKRALYELGRKMLEEVDYHEVGMDHFALKTDSLWKAAKDGSLHRNFMGYISRQVSPLIGLGVSAIGDSWSAFGQNEKLLETYQARLEKGELPIFRGHLLTVEDRILRRHILNLMTQRSTQWTHEEAGQAVHLERIESNLKELIQDGLVEFNDNKCQITEKGGPFIRNICMAFDAKLYQAIPREQVFSKTI